MAEKISVKRLKALKNEIRMADELNKRELEPIVDEAIQRYTGRHVPAFGASWDIVLNEIYPVIQNELPSIFFRNPRAFLKPRNKTFIAKQRDPVSGKMTDVQLDSTKSARTQEHILNYALTEIKYKNEVRKVLLDALLYPHGILWHGYKGDFGMTEEQSIFIRNDMVFVTRVSPLRFIKDPSVTMSNLAEAKWVGRIIDIPLDDLLEDDKLDVNKKQLKGFEGYGQKIGMFPRGNKNKSDTQDFVPNKSLIDYTEDEFRKNSSSRFVRVAEIYLRPTKKEKREGKKGLVLLLTDEQEQPLRQNKWSIKAEGFPAHVLQFNELPDQFFGMADIDVYANIGDQKNIITNLQIRNAQETTKTYVGISKQSANEEDVEAVRQGQNSIIFFEDGNPRERMFVANAGGNASSELYLIDQRIQRNLEDKSGITDLKRGFLQSGEESATSVKLRSAGGGARPAYRQDIMSDFLKDSLHFLMQMLKQFMPIRDAVRVVGSLDIEWSENPTKEELQADVDVEIDVISMLPENPEKEIRELNTVLSLMVNAIQSPEIRTKLQQEGKTMNLSPLIEQMLLRLRIRDPEIFRNIEPAESQGFVSVQQMREAQANIAAALSGQPIPHPPKEEDDHRAKIETYSSTAQILQAVGQVSDTLQQLIQVQSALLQAAQEKQDKAPREVKLPGPSIQTVGTP